MFKPNFFNTLALTCALASPLVTSFAVQAAPGGLPADLHASQEAQTPAGQSATSILAANPAQNNAPSSKNSLTTGENINQQASKSKNAANGMFLNTASGIAKPTDFSETIHGVKVADPYRYMENIDSPQVKAWIALQRNKTERYMSEVPNRVAIRNYLKKLQDYPRFGAPFREANHWFYFYNSGLQNQSVLYMTDSPQSEGQAILDPNTFSKDGTAALTDTVPSPDGRYLAFSVAQSGSDWNSIQVLDLQTKKNTQDRVDWVKFSNIVWDANCSGFYYSRYPAPKESSETLAGVNEGHALYFHRLGTSQDEDELIFDNPDNPNISIYASRSEDCRWLCLEIAQSHNKNTALLVKDTSSPNTHFLHLPNAFEAKFSPVAIKDGVLYAITNYKAPNSRLVKVKLTNNIINTPWEEVIPQAKESLEGISCVGGHFFANYLQDAASKVLEYDLDGKQIRQVQLPGLGSVGSFSGKLGDTTAYYSYTSFNTPSVIYAYDIPSGQSTIWHKPNLSFDPDDFVTKQVFVPSTDGAKVPLFITHRRDLKINGDTPTLLYGYGGFSISMTPYFSTRTMTWMQMGGIYAQASLRGGSEYGESWHIAGTRTQKQHTFDDFINCAQWLIDNKYTKPSRLAINGGSNGGLLVGACLNQRPDLFGAAVPQVGVMDMLRFHKFTIGRHWVGDYGDVDKEAEFKTLYKISPYHNIKPGTKYPATLITTGDHDDRVFPAHSFKYAAALQAAQAGDAPILIRIETKAGHGAGKPIAKRLDENADILSFIAKALGMKDVGIVNRK